VKTLQARRNTALLERVEPVDLIKYGLIPEFVEGCPLSERSGSHKAALVES